MEEAGRLHNKRKAAPAAANIYVVDDDQAFCASIVRWLSNAGFRVRTYPTADAFLQDSIADAPGCILLGLHLRGRSGLDVQNILARQPMFLPIIVISADGTIPTVVRAMKAGAMDFLVKPVESRMLLEAINRSLSFFGRQQERRRLIATWKAAFDTLSEREAQVFSLVTSGKMNKEIASELGITLRTVKAHRGHMMVKMRVASLAELVHIADTLPPQASFRPSV